MVSNARLDLPLPERPVMTTSRSRGNARSTSLRLCSRAPCTKIRSWGTVQVYAARHIWNRCSIRGRRFPTPRRRSFGLADLPGAILLLERERLVVERDRLCLERRLDDRLGLLRVDGDGHRPLERHDRGVAGHGGVADGDLRRVDLDRLE